MAKRLAKRFYGSVTVESLDDGWAVFLDGMQLRTPGKLKLALPTKPLAAWDKWRDWAAGQGVDLNVTFSVAAISQPEASCLAVRTYAQSLDDLPLTLFVHLVAVFGSVVAPWSSLWLS